MLPTALREVITAGEQLRTTPQLVDFFHRMPDCRLHNHYGPTETHVVTSFALDPSPERWPALPPIGKPIANTQIFILDQRLERAPVGEPGELYIGGCSLARGYIGHPELVADRFTPHPYGTKAGARLYRTGDLARLLPDGNIEFLGRKDQQIKLRGFRIEPGEIEMVLCQCRAVRQAAVSVAGDDDESAMAPGDGRRLVAYIVPMEMPGPTVSDLHAFLRERLPEYMLPSAFVFLNALPLTPSGKIDLAALPALDSQRPELESSFHAPRTPVEEGLAEVWKTVLRLDQVGIYDNFFELGGHSLLATQVVSRIRDTFHVDLSLRTVFESPTIAKLSLLIGRSSHALDKSGSHAGALPEGWEVLVL